MKEKRKKRIVVILLLISCFFSGYMLLAVPGNTNKGLDKLAQVDSLIRKEFSNFNIDVQQVQASEIQVDSAFSRKTYQVRVPYDFSKTQFHANLNSSLYEYSVQAPARVTFPEQNVNIHLLYKGTVIRSLSLQTDPDLHYNQRPISLIVVFKQVPDNELVEALARLGEKIPMVIEIEMPSKAGYIRKQLDKRYKYIALWLQNNEGEDLIQANPDIALAKLYQIEQLWPSARVLFHAPGESRLNPQRLYEETDLRLIKADNALLLHEELGKASFYKELEKINSDSPYSMAIVHGTRTTLSWLSEKIPALKKAGAVITHPREMNL